jgi:hypothetical protein
MPNQQIATILEELISYIEQTLNSSTTISKKSKEQLSVKIASIRLMQSQPNKQLEPCY